MSGNLAHLDLARIFRELDHQRRPSFDAVREASLGQWPAILPALGIPAESLTNRHGPCPGCGGTDRFRYDDLDGRGTWICGGAGAVQAGDAFDLLGHVHGWTASEALRQVARVLGMDEGSAPLVSRRAPVAPKPKAPARDSWHSICPIPEEALEGVEGVVHPTLGPVHLATHCWAYQTPDGRDWFNVLRYQSGTSKAVLPLSYGRHEGGRLRLDWKRPAFLILWNLPELYARPEAPVLVAEGEKAADAAEDLLPEYVATCHHGGASQAHLTCLHDLAGRNVTLLPDDDAASVDQWVPELATLLAGTGAHVSIADPLRAEGAELVRGKFLDHTATGTDAADLPATAEGSARLRALVQAARPFAEVFPHVSLEEARAWAAHRNEQRLRRVHG